MKPLTPLCFRNTPQLPCRSCQNSSPKISKSTSNPLSSIDYRKDISYYLLAESPRTVLLLQKFLRYVPWGHTRVRGIIFGAEDFAQEVGITRTPSLTEMTYARQHVVMAAKSYRLECLDLVRTSYKIVVDIGIHKFQGYGCSTSGM